MGGNLTGFLVASKVEFEFLEKKVTHHAGEASAASGISLSDLVKTIVFLDQNSKPLIAVVLGEQTVSRHKLQECSESKEVRIAPDDIAEAITGYPTGAEEVALAPAVTRLEQNHPNPFNPSTSIRFVLASAGPVSLRIFDSQGRVVRTLLSGRAPAGDHLISWDANDQGGRAVGSGVYFYRLEASGFSESRKMVLMR